MPDKNKIERFGDSAKTYFAKSCRKITKGWWNSTKFLVKNWDPISVSENLIMKKVKFKYYEKMN